MAADMCAAERAAVPKPEIEFGTIIIVGGGCYGTYYLRQLRRAAAAGAASWRRLLIVDRDPACAVAVAADAAGGASDVEIVTEEWDTFFGDRLARAASAPGSASRDAIVPSPLMPHLLYDWLLARARERWPARAVRAGTIGGSFPVPWQRDSSAGDTRYVSFAEWTCPVNCIEPARCPVTRGPRTWSLPPAVEAFVSAERAAGRRLLGPHVFHCSHRCYGVGMIDVADVIAADAAIANAASTQAAEVLVGTVSHCHGALGIVAIDV
jgi:hypothetical protein